MWRWVSIMPGITMPSEASISSAPSGASSDGPTSAIVSPTTSTSASRRMSWASFMVSTVPRRSTIGRPVSISLKSGSSPSGCQAPFQPTVAWSRNQDELGAALGAALTFPGGLDLLERQRLDVDHDVTGRYMPGELQESLLPQLRWRVGDREAAQVERDGAHRRRRQRNLQARELADLDVPGEARRRLDRGRRGLPPERVDHDVELALGRRLVRGGQIVLRVECDDGVGAALEPALEAFPAPVRRDDPARPEELRDLDRERPERAARSEDEHGVAWLQARPPRQRQPRAEARVAERRGGHVVEVRVDLEQRTLARERALGHRAERGDGLVEVDAAPVGQTADAVGADGAWQRRRPHVERAARLQQVEVVQPGGADIDDDGARSRIGIVERPVAGRGPVLVQDGGVHLRLSVSATPGR